jgi:hypothetical protein
MNISPRQLAFLGFAILILVPILYFVFRDGGDITNYPPKNQTIVAFGVAGRVVEVLQKVMH